MDECLLVEGYTDVVSLHQAGIENVVASGGTSLTIDQLRLVKKNTDNLTIIYDGDSAGVKAALRGLDMALEEGLNVRLVLIPENEDPDSYVNKVGVSAFQQFIKENKKDFIIFHLEVMLKEAGTDTCKKAQVVNLVAETLSKFNKPEDFTKLQDYIRQCSELLKIDEGGLTNLVNKLKRDKVAKEEKNFDSRPVETQVWPEEGSSVPEDFTNLFYNDELQEKNVIRVLLEYGLQQWDEEKTMAEYIFEQLDEYHVEHPDLEKLLEVYKKQYEDGLQPTSKSLLYYEDEKIRNTVINMDVQPYELSPNWDKIMEGMNINNKDISRQDVIMSLNYFKLRKIKKMFDDNQRDIEKAATFEEQMQLIMIHKSLKEEEQLITKELGTVIVK
ncbi:MAG: primase [Segetibacter sp.]|nr:primase [Segetibacter sp.]